MNFVKKYYNYLLSFLLLVCFLFLLFPCGAFIDEGKEILNTSGLQMIFGLKVKTYRILSFSLLGFMMLILLSIAMVIPHFKKYVGKLYVYIEVAIIFVCSILYYLLPLIVNHQVMYVSNNFKGLVALYIGASLLLSVGVLVLFVDKKINSSK